jgi:MFS family permease
LAAVSFVVTAIAIAVAATAPTIAVEAVAFALLAASANLLWVMTSAVIQTGSTPATRGRMNGIFYTIASAGTSIGALLMAEFMNLIGITGTLLAYATILLLVGALTALRRHTLADSR